MTAFVFEFKGLPALRASALEVLRQKLPSGSLVTPKTSAFVEVRIADGAPVSPLPELQQKFGAAWDVSLPTYAEISPPKLNLDAVRDKLGT